MNDLSLIRMYNCGEKVKGANKRFDDKITSEDVLFSLKINNFNCFYCNDKIDYKNWQLDHFNPRANKGLNKRENLVACCKWCNTMKNALDGNSFINKCSQIVSNNYFSINNIGDYASDKKNSLKLRKIKKVLSKYSISEISISEIKEILNTFY